MTSRQNISSPLTSPRYGRVGCACIPGNDCTPRNVSLSRVATLYTLHFYTFIREKSQGTCSILRGCGDRVSQGPFSQKSLAHMYFTVEFARTVFFFIRRRPRHDPIVLFGPRINSRVSVWGCFFPGTKKRKKNPT